MRITLIGLLLTSLLQAQTLTILPNRPIKDKNKYSSFKEIWIWGKDTLLSGDSVCVVVFDADLDGCYIGSHDYIALLPYGIDSAYCRQYDGVRSSSPNLVLGYKGKAYQLLTDTNRCKQVTLVERPDLAPPVDLRIGDQLPPFSFRLFDGDSVDIYRLMQPGKYTYIEFWGTWCPGCVQSLPVMKTLHETKQDSLVILSLNYGDSPEKAKAFVLENGLRWSQGFSNPAIQTLLFAGEVFPYGVLVDPQGRIIAFNVSPRRVSGYMGN